MAANSGDVIFKRNQDALEDENESMWDDTALIDAYDRAVSMTYDAVNTKDGSRMPKKESNKFPGAKRRRGGKKTKRKWNEHDKCLARYSEDQHWYEATIISIDRERNTCVVRYDEYENEEEQNLANLERLPHDGKAENDDEMVETDTTEDEQFADISESAFDETNNAGGEAVSGYIPALPNGMHHRHHMVPNLPPPPPLAGDSREQQALSSMLMSWYMSGYHTGYYQAIRDVTKHPIKKSNAKNQ